MADETNPKADNIDQHQYSQRKLEAARFLREEKLLRLDALEHIKKKEGNGVKGRPFYAYDDDTGARTIGYGMNIDEEHNREWMIGKVGEEEFQNLYDGLSQISPELAELGTIYNIDIAFDEARKDLKAYDKKPYDVKKVVLDMYYNIGGGINDEDSMPKFIEAIDKNDYYQASQDLKYNNPTEGNMSLTGYYTSTGDRARENYAVLEAYPRIEETDDGLMFHFHDKYSN